MARDVQEIEAEKTDRGIRMRHPSFGQIGASRVSGRRSLYGSDFEHNSYISITISTSELERDLSRDWPFAKRQLIEVALSEAQWATFVSAMNVGEGVQCTIERRHDTGMVPSFPLPDRTAQYRAEFNAKLQKALGGLEDLRGMVQAAGLSKKATGSIVDAVAAVMLEIKHNMPFVSESFDEHVEETIAKMKSEVHGYIQGVLQRTGLEVLQGKSPVQIESKSAGKTELTDD